MFPDWNLNSFTFQAGIQKSTYVGGNPESFFFGFNNYHH